MPDAMPHHLLGLYDSPFVRRVAITMTHYGVPFEHTSLSVFRHMDAMRPLNPLFKVPMLVLPSGEKLYESAYILDHLDEEAAARGQTPLTPPHGAARRAVLQASALGMIAVEKAVALVYEFRRPDDKRWPEWEARLREQMRQALVLLEAQLNANGDWLVGQAMTQADVTAAVTVGFIRYVVAEEWPVGLCAHLEGLGRRLENTAAFRAVPIDEE